MAEKKIIAVMGATGAQGNGLVKAILNDPDGGFAVRAITRDVNSEKAKELAELGAEVVAADLDNAESVQQAFGGAYGAFCVTFFWNHFSPDKEIEHVQIMAEAAKRAGLQHVIWSTLEDTRKWIPLSDDRMPTLLDQYKVPHFDAKGSADRFFVNAGVPTTFLLASFYWDNMIHFGMGPKRGEDGALAITFPMGNKKLVGIGAEDIGKCAYGILKAGPAEYAGKFVGIAGDHLTGEELAAELTKAFNEEVRYNAVSPEVYRSFGFPGADDLGNMFQYYQEFDQVFCASRDLEVSRTLNPSLQRFEDWLTQNKQLIPID
ncbi:NmrA/HSCARG family protein [Paenibacillus abyssi]|uniref:Nucleotide-diphosphate-sugar epimerase n=1 Tax=Paenibacillus abyssi TaxID=1340531 RepID=A0A917LEL2_9BACL|nr:NmrA/HSCARG family protein [Paenibacillus abyssi]GGG15631.1 nucleotide-diphosphate-sugar epimerase [Paenibacillus abyssi]